MRYKSIFLGFLILSSILQTSQVDAIEWKEVIGEVIYTSVHFARDYAPVIVSVSPFITAAAIKAYLWWQSVRIQAQAEKNGKGIAANKGKLEELGKEIQKLEAKEDAAAREQRQTQNITQVKDEVTKLTDKIGSLETQEGAQAARKIIENLLAEHGLELNKTNISVEEMKEILIILQAKETVSPKDLSYCLEKLKKELIESNSQMVSKTDLDFFKTQMLNALTEQTKTFLARFDDVVDQNDQGPSTPRIVISQQFGPGGGPASFGSSVGLNSLYYSTGLLMQSQTTLPSHGRGKPVLTQN